MSARRFMLLLIFVLVAFSVLLVAIGFYMMSGMVFSSALPPGWQETGEGQLAFRHVPADEELVVRLESTVEVQWQKLLGMFPAARLAPVVVYLHPSGTHFEAAGGPKGATASVGVDGSIHLVCTPATRGGVEEALLSELVELALWRSYDTRPTQVPGWLIEGLASWAAGSATDESRPAGGEFFQYMLRREGETTMVSFLGVVATGESTLDQAFLSHFGQSEAALRAEWEFQRKRSSAPPISAIGVGFGGLVLVVYATSRRKTVRTPAESGRRPTRTGL